MAGGTASLMLDLQVVAQRMGNPIGLDHAADERIRTIGVAKVHAGANPLDTVPPDHPAECRTLG